MVTGKKVNFTFNQTIFLPFFGRTKTCSLRFLKNSREISLHDLDLESFYFTLGKEWKPKLFTFHLSGKGLKNICFTFHLSNSRLYIAGQKREWMQSIHQSRMRWDINQNLPYGPISLSSRRSIIQPESTLIQLRISPGASTKGNTFNPKNDFFFRSVDLNP